MSFVLVKKSEIDELINFHKVAAIRTLNNTIEDFKNRRASCSDLATQLYRVNYHLKKVGWWSEKFVPGIKKLLAKGEAGLYWLLDKVGGPVIGTLFGWLMGSTFKSAVLAAGAKLLGATSIGIGIGAAGTFLFYLAPAFLLTWLGSWIIKKNVREATKLKEEARSFGSMEKYFEAEPKKREKLEKKFNSLAEIARFLNLKSIEELEEIDNRELASKIKNLEKSPEKLKALGDVFEELNETLTDKINTEALAAKTLEDPKTVENLIRNNPKAKQRLEKAIALTTQEMDEETKEEVLQGVAKIDPNARKAVETLAEAA